MRDYFPHDLKLYLTYLLTLLSCVVMNPFTLLHLLTLLAICSLAWQCFTFHVQRAWSACYECSKFSSESQESGIAIRRDSTRFISDPDQRASARMSFAWYIFRLYGGRETFANCLSYSWGVYPNAKHINSNNNK